MMQYMMQLIVSRKNGPALVNDMHHPLKRDVSIFVSKLLRNILKLIKKQFSDLYFLRVMSVFVHNFQVFIPTKYGKK